VHFLDDSSFREPALSDYGEELCQFRKRKINDFLPLHLDQ
jgi:hypothetical protein